MQDSDFCWQHGANPAKPPESESSSDNAHLVRLQQRKLRLEESLLRQRLSRSEVAREWLKAAAVPAAVFGALLTFYVGFNQLNQSERNREADRFDRALTRLASEQVRERITGVSGLRLFISDSNSPLRASALEFLANAVAVESDPLVQRACLNVFRNLEGEKHTIPRMVLDGVLNSAIKHNRALASSLQTRRREKVLESQRRILGDSDSVSFPTSEISSPVPKKLIANLTQKEYLDYLGAEDVWLDELESDFSVRLLGLAELIAILVRAGAVQRDFSGIYCEDCDFSGVKQLRGANFEAAYLSGANFSRAALNDARFYEADLRGTIFFAADLSGADLRITWTHRHILGIEKSFPLLECAILKGANLSGMPLIAYKRSFSTLWKGHQAVGVDKPKMLNTQVDESTTIESFTVITYTMISDEYISRYPDSKIVTYIQDRDGAPEDPVVPRRWIPTETSRIAGEMTTFIQYSEIAADRSDQVRPAAKQALGGYLPPADFSAIMLVEAFNEGKAGADVSHSCADDTQPSAQQLVDDGGMQSVESEDFVTRSVGRKTDE